MEKIVQPAGRGHESEPLLMQGCQMVDVNATIPPISPDGATLTIRKFSKENLQVTIYSTAH